MFSFTTLYLSSPADRHRSASTNFRQDSNRLRRNVPGVCVSWSHPFLGTAATLELCLDLDIKVCGVRCTITFPTKTSPPVPTEA
jgi:hypothetical protein